MCHGQCDQIGRFFKVHGNQFSYKSSQNIWVAFGAILKKHQTTVATIWSTLRNTWATFYFYIWSYLWFKDDSYELFLMHVAAVEGCSAKNIDFPISARIQQSSTAACIKCTSCEWAFIATNWTEKSNHVKYWHYKQLCIFELVTKYYRTLAYCLHFSTVT